MRRLSLLFSLVPSRAHHVLTGPASLHRLYWLGIYEKYTVHTMAWMFERDYFSGVWSIISLLWALAMAGARQLIRECYAR